MELEGEVIEIIYKNETNSYCIAVLQLDKNSMKAGNKKTEQISMLSIDEEEIDK